MEGQDELAIRIIKGEAPAPAEAAEEEGPEAPEADATEETADDATTDEDQA